VLGFDGLIGLFYKKDDGIGTTYWAPQGWNDQFASTDPSLFTPNNNLFVGRTEPQQTEKSVFGELSYHLTDAWSITAGLRHYDIESSSITNVSGLFNDFANPAAVTTTTIAADSKGEVYKFNISYGLAESRLLYAQYSEGFRPGFGLNPLPANCAPDLEALGIDPNVSQVGPDSTRNYEIGAKTSWRDSSLIINAAVYRIDWDDIQQALFLPCGVNLVRNAGAARNEGVELEARSALSEHMEVGATLSYIDSQFLEDVPEFGAKKGDRIADVPPWQGAVFADLSFTTPLDWEGDVRLDFQYADATYFDYRHVGTERDPLSRRDPLTLLNLHFALSHGPWRLELYGNNLLNDIERLSRAESLVLEVPGRPRFVMNQPRTFGVAVSFSL
jgi:outer membrane receptor protein involved in Fe transport